MKLTRDILRERHRLSHRQTDDWLGEHTDWENTNDRLQSMQRIAAFLDTAKALKEEEIWFVSLKGPLLSQRIYGDPTYRTFRDFDILIHPEEIGRVLRLLETMGYEPQGLAWPRSEKKQRITLHFINQIEMVNPASGIMMEIHWKLFSGRITDEKTVGKLIRENIETVEFGGLSLNRFSIEFKLFYLLVHGGIHAWFRLKWLVDIHEILKRETIEWEKFNRIVSECSARRLVEICNSMLNEYFPDGIKLSQAANGSSSLASVAIEQCKKSVADPHETRFNTLKLLRYRMKLFPYLPYKLDVLKVITFCKTDLKYDWLPPYTFVYYLFRPLGYVLRGIGVLE